LVEQLIRNQQVTSSSLVAGSNRIDHFSLATGPPRKARYYRRGIVLLS
jgi:hypothetical protein